MIPYHNMTSIKNQRIIITGGNGFIGTALTLRLKHLGFKHVLRTGRHTPAEKDSDFIITHIENKEDLRSLIQKGDIVVHLASSALPNKSSQNVIQDVKENLESSIALLEVGVEKEIKKIIFLSSSWSVYGNHEIKKSKETDPVSPINYYGALKLSIEKYIEATARLSGVEYAILRLGNAYGKKYSEQNALVVDIFIHKILNHETCTINGDGKLVRDYIYIDDVVDFITKAISEKKVQGVINIGTGTGVSLKDLIATVEKVSGITAKVEYKKTTAPAAPYHVLNITHAKSFNWKPRFTLRQGIEKIISNTKIS